MHLIIIGGAQRSGTTLLQTLIANAMNAPLLAEADILFDLVDAYQRAKTDRQKTLSFYDADGLTKFFRAAVERHLLDVYARHASTSHIVLKHPHFACVLDSVAELLPKSTRVVIARDPRDIAASYIKIGLREIELGRTSRYTKRDLRFVCEKINAAYGNPFLSLAENEAAAVVRYEELAQFPGDALDRLSSQTGLMFDLTSIERARWLPAESRHQQTWISQLEERPPTPDSIGNYGRLLTASEIATVERECAEVMARFAYSDDLGRLDRSDSNSRRSAPPSP